MADDDLIQDIMNRARGFPGSSPFDAKAVAAMGSDFSFPDTPSKSDSIADLLSPSSDSPQKFEGIPTKTGERMDMDTYLRGAGVGGSALTDADKEMIDSMKQRNAMLEKIKEKEIKDLQQFQKDRMELMAKQPKVPQLGNIPKAPQSQFRNPFDAFQNPAVMLGMLGSLFTRQPLTTAFNAAAAAMKGFHEGDTEVIKQETTNWKNAVDQALQQNQKEIDEYKLQWDQHKGNLNELISNFETTAAINKDEQMLTLLKFAGPKEIYEMIETREKAHIELEEARAKVVKARAEAVKAQAQADNIRQLQSGGGIGGWNAKAIRNAAENYVQMGPTAIPSNLGTREVAGAIKGAIMQEVENIKEERNLSSEDMVNGWAQYKGTQAYQRSAGTMASRVENAVNELEQTIPLALQSSRNLPRGSFVPLNKLVQAFEAGTSNPQYNDFITRNLAVINAYTRAMNPQGVPRIAERAEQHAMGILSQATSPAAYEVQLRAVWAEAEASKKATAETRSGVGTPKDFPGGIAPATAEGPNTIALDPGYSAVEIDSKTGKPVTSEEPTQKDEEDRATLPGAPGLPIGGF